MVYLVVSSAPGICYANRSQVRGMRVLKFEHIVLYLLFKFSFEWTETVGILDGMVWKLEFELLTGYSN